MINNLIIFYFSGTGNAFAATNWIAETFSESNIPVKIYRITPSLQINKPEIDDNTLVGFCYPTHGFNAPPVVINFILGFPKLKNQIFLLNTRAGMKLNKLFLPGLSGLAQLLPALILRLKGFRIIGFQPMDLPSNWISIHPGLRQKVIDSIFIRCKKITKRFAEKLLENKKIYRGFISLPIDLLISPVSVGYYFFGRFALAKTFIAGNQCNSCRICEKECPVHAIKMKKNRPFWTRKCESCMHCMNICPKKAIQTPHLFVVIIWWLVFSVIPISLVKITVKPDSFVFQNYDFFVWIYLFLTGLPILFLSYRILHFLMRFRFFNRLITYTSLTKFKFWRRYFAPKKYLKE